MQAAVLTAQGWLGAVRQLRGALLAHEQRKVRPDGVQLVGPTLLTALARKSTLKQAEPTRRMGHRNTSMIRVPSKSVCSKLDRMKRDSENAR
ncbi:hypothetical protein [Mycobacterium sp.]|uniref:hypothetical protein n=1 Tax=Mycobacterium sp. TaxID=1785 RepID=UPI002C161DCF|nr:hypothetical protein [Mycobacterium sp.]HTQ19752.1 hypothetical protein [Mycobacterium sp.]